MSDSGESDDSEKKPNNDSKKKQKSNKNQLVFRGEKIYRRSSEFSANSGGLVQYLTIHGLIIIIIPLGFLYAYPSEQKDLKEQIVNNLLRQKSCRLNPEPEGTNS